MILCGDSLHKLKELKENSVDAIVTDPPYGLSFMGKSWDYDVPKAELWREVLRVLKPGGHMLAFFGTRTYHRGVCAIEDAGFEIRDQLAWNYGQGFPKSHNLKGDWQGWGTALKPSWETICLASKPLTSECLLISLVRECQSKLFVQIVKNHFSLNLKGLSEDANIVQWIAGKNTLTQEGLKDLTDMLQSELAINTNLNTELLWLDLLDAVLLSASTYTTEMAINLITDLKILNCLLSNSTQKNILQEDGRGKQSNVFSVKKILTDLEQKLNYILTPSVQDPVINQEKHTGLRPELSPIVLARKPLSEKTVAANVLRWGVGAINVDESRIAADLKNEDLARGRRSNGKMGYGGNEGVEIHMTPNIQGRWPANVLFDESAAEVLDAQSGNLGLSKGASRGAGGQHGKYSAIGSQDHPLGFGDSGGASRFFYVAKSSKRERGEGNNHPTVKPIKLMQYLIKLITPPNGTVLDPFMGSGSTGVACKALGFEFIGIELNKDYAEIAQKRIEASA